MTEIIGRTTRLAAVNQILRAIGERQTASLVDNNRGDVSAAVSSLDESSKIVQQEGWAFNRATMTLEPEEDGRIPVPQAALSITGVDSPEVVFRGDYMYDKHLQTYKFTRDVVVEVVLLLPFSELSEPCRQYITARASRVVCQDRVGDQLMMQALGQDEARTRIIVEKEESDAGAYNVSESPTIGRIYHRWHL